MLPIYFYTLFYLDHKLINTKRLSRYKITNVALIICYWPLVRAVPGNELGRNWEIGDR